MTSPAFQDIILKPRRHRDKQGRALLEPYIKGRRRLLEAADEIYPLDCDPQESAYAWPFLP
jgi:hypothetical protein